MRKLVTRKQWGARPRTSRTILPASAVRFLVVHYSGADSDEQSSHARCAERVRGIQRFHMSPTPSDPTKPWSDVAYSWIVCKHGSIYSCRGWRTRTAATGPANSFSVAVCFLGDDTTGRDDVTDAGRAGLREVFEFVKRNAPNLEGVRGHRDFMATSCPGDQLLKFVRLLDREV